MKSFSRLARFAVVVAVGVFGATAMSLTSAVANTKTAVERGPAGPRGAQGPTGPQGPMGLTGATGAGGSSGATGPRGPAGNTGAAGKDGANGTAGVAGPAAWSKVTAYSNSVTYSAGPPASVVTYQGGTYVYVGSSPSSAAPTNATDWEQVAAPGQTGPQGNPGPTGSTGSQGIQGERGPQGLPGCAQGQSTSCTNTALGNKVGPIVAGGVSLTGSTTYSVAGCPAGDEVYGGGGYIQINGAKSGGDVVTLESSFPGTSQGPGAEVTPITSGVAGDAYEAKAVVTTLNQGDNYTLQAYAICGP